MYKDEEEKKIKNKIKIESDDIQENNEKKKEIKMQKECCNTNTGDIKIKNNDNGNYYDHKEFESYKERKNFNNNYIIFTKAIKENQKYNIKQNKNKNDDNSDFTYGIKNDIQIQIKKFIPKGLRNLGNNCYMNSLLQCLYYVPELREYFINENFNYNQELSLALKDVFIGLKDSNKNSYSPDLIRKEIKKLDNLFMTGKQADAADLLNNIFSKLVEELGKEDSYCGTIQYENDVFNKDAMFADTVNYVDKDLILNKLFNGYYMSETICKKGHIQYTFQNDYLMAFNMKNINKNTITLYDCISQYQEKKNIKDLQNCQNCNSNINIFQQKIYQPGNYMIFVFNGFMENNKTFEIQEYIYLKSDDGFKYQYILTSASIYFGSGKSGHYIAYCRADDGQFYSFNDSLVSLISFNKIKVSIPYILFYKKIDKSENIEEIMYKKILKITKKHLAGVFEIINDKYDYDFEEKLTTSNEIIWEDTINIFKLTINFDDFFIKKIIKIKNEKTILNYKWNNIIEDFEAKLEEIINESYSKKNCCQKVLMFLKYFKF